MSSLWPVLGAIACPLGMFAMGGVAWAARKLGRGERSSRVARGAGMLACNPLTMLSRRRGRDRSRVAGEPGGLASQRWR